MNLAVWKDGSELPKVLGGLSPAPTDVYPERYLCRIDRLIAADDHYEIYPEDVSGKRMHVDGISCWPTGGDIVFRFVESGYV